MRKTFLTLLCVSSAIAHAADEDGNDSNL
ncbi:hypothetical protein OCN73_24720, partial [Escherichia coli]|nr:hypothetical protein [Escherichia coli]MDU9756174.1 hypothetical protein [Escherichia coli]